MKLSQGKIEDEYMLIKNKEKNMRKTEKLESELNTLYGFDVIQG